MKLSEELTKALIKGYYLKDFDGWKTDVEDGDPYGLDYEDNSLNLGYGVSIECYVPGDDCTVCFIQWDASLAIEHCEVAVDEEKIVIIGSEKESRIEILHDSLPGGYIEKNCRKRLKGRKKKQSNIFLDLSEYVGMPEYECDPGPVLDEMLDMMRGYFERGEEDAVPWIKNGDAAECTIEIIPGHFLRMIKDGPVLKKEKTGMGTSKQTTLMPIDKKDEKIERNNRYELTWTSHDGTHKLFFNTRSVCFGVGEIQIGYRDVIRYNIGKQLRTEKSGEDR